MKKKLSIMLLLTLALNLVMATTALATDNNGDCGEENQSTEVSITSFDEFPW
jgi:hypothetical protein